VVGWFSLPAENAVMALKAGDSSMQAAMSTRTYLRPREQQHTLISSSHNVTRLS
jgi:hypothetical protein